MKKKQVNNRDGKTVATVYPNTALEEKAWRRSDGYYFHGKKLQPLGFVRQSAFVALLSQSGISELDEIANMLWLLSQPDSVAQRVRRRPDEYMGEVAKFAEQNGITMFNGNGEAKEIYDAICEDLKASTSKPDGAADGEEEDDPN